MRNLLFILMFFNSFLLQAQSEMRLYGYSQASSKGIRAMSVDENGTMSSEKKTQSKNYLIYVEIPKNENYEFTELWINGLKYRFEQKPVNAPVTMQTGIRMPGQKDSVLIPLSDKVLLQLVPYTDKPITVKNTRKQARNNEILVCFRSNGKNKSKQLAKAVKLPDLVSE